MQQPPFLGHDVDADLLVLEDLLEKNFETLRGHLRNDVRDELLLILSRSCSGGGDIGGTGSVTPTVERPYSHAFGRLDPTEGLHRPETFDEFPLPFGSKVCAGRHSTMSQESFFRPISTEGPAWSAKARAQASVATINNGDSSMGVTSQRAVKPVKVDPKVKERLQENNRKKKSVIFGKSGPINLSSTVRRSSIGRGKMSSVHSGSIGSTKSRIMKSVYGEGAAIARRLQGETREDGRTARPKGCGSCIRSFIVGPDFDYLSGFLVLVNAVLMGVQTDWEARHQSRTPEFFKVVEHVFAGVFLAELVLRMWANGLKFFMVDTRWNVFDLVLVLFQLVEKCMEVVAVITRTDRASMGNLNFMRILKIMRLVRVVRLMRVIRLVSELRALVMSIGGSLRSLIWAILLLFVMMYVVGVYLTQLVSDARMASAGSDDVDRARLIQYWGSLGDSIYSLWLSVTGGVDWKDVVAPLRTEIGVWIVPVFMFYIAFAMLCMLNVITGVFVESALQSAKVDKDVYMIEHVRSLFDQFDEDESGSISWEEFQSMCGSSGADSLLVELGMDRVEAESLFKLLDVDNTGSIDLNEFIHGCSRLRGPVKFLDFSLMQRHTNHLAEIQRNWASDIARQLRMLDDTLRDVREIREQYQKPLTVVQKVYKTKPPVYPPPTWGILEEA